MSVLIVAAVATAFVASLLWAQRKPEQAGRIYDESLWSRVIVWSLGLGLAAGIGVALAGGTSAAVGAAIGVGILVAGVASAFLASSLSRR